MHRAKDDRLVRASVLPVCDNGKRIRFEIVSSDNAELFNRGPLRNSQTNLVDWKI